MPADARHSLQKLDACQCCGADGDRDGIDSITSIMALSLTYQNTCTLLTRAGASSSLVRTFPTANGCTVHLVPAVGQVEIAGYLRSCSRLQAMGGIDSLRLKVSQ